MTHGTFKNRGVRKRYFLRPMAGAPAGARQPHRPAYPAVFLDDIALVRETPFIEAVLLGCRVELRDLPDVVQEVLTGAWRTMGAGRFRPKPQAPLQDSLRAWLYGISWRQASHYREVAYRRYEVSIGRPTLLDAEPLTEGQVSARLLLAVFRRLPHKYQEVLALVAVGEAINEIARELMIRPGTANNRIRRGRRLFRRAIARWRK